MSDLNIVAAVGARNQRLFDETLTVLPGRWRLVTRPDELTVERVRELGARRIFLLHWSWKVATALIHDYECIGFHMTDLPYGRGGSPLQNLILRGHATTMLSAFRLTDDFDAGPVYLKRPLSLEGRAEDIYQRASRLAADMIQEILASRSEPQPQQGEVTVFQRRTPAASRLPPAATPIQLYDFVRMLDAEGYPRAFVDVGEWRIELFDAQLDADGVRVRARFLPKVNDPPS